MPSRMLAFVLLSTKLGSEQHVLDELERVGGIRKAYVVYGSYDLIAEIEGESQDAVKEVVLSNIRKLKDVKSTLTLIVPHGE